MRATYRVQLGPGFGFAELGAAVDYLADLGISHLYCSPILEAARGSTHGYDVTDPTRISADLGGEDGFRAVLDAARSRELRVLLDIVPNHMSVADRRNRWWWDVLVAGRSSPFARYFDINWDHHLVRGRVMAPLLDRPLEEALEQRLVQLTVDAGVVVAYHDDRLPLSRETLPRVLEGTELAGLAERIRDAEFAEERIAAGDELAQRLAAGGGAEASALTEVLQRWNRDHDALRALLDDQNYALTDWREAATVMNYRNFFDITSLVGVRVEDPEVVDATHVLVDSLLDRGDVDGVRVDHVDGLRQPRGYLERMRGRHPDRGIWVEKILSGDEALPGDWAVDGTTGYEFGALAGGLFIDPAGWAALRQSWAEATGHPDDFEEIARQAKLQVMGSTLRPNVDRLVRMLGAVCRDRGREELSDAPDRLRSGVVEYLLGLDVYRTYIDVADAAPDPADRARICAALRRAAEGGGDAETLQVMGALLLQPRDPGLEHDFVLRLQQASTVVRAKGVEDTAFYRFPVLSAACEVGASPGHPAVGVAEFHAANAERQRRWPHSLVATATHDSKRGEDVRARLYLLSELAAAWPLMTRRWRQTHAELFREGMPGRTMSELLFQTMVGAWPIDADRLTKYMLKASSEAKQRTSWIEPDSGYQEALAELVRALLDDATMVSELSHLTVRLVEPGRVTSLALTLLRLTSPGIPDTYQGTELWQLDLVDPDNRRPVDYSKRQRLLGEMQGGRPPEVAVDADGLTKLLTVHTALELRRRRPELFGERGDYLSLPIRGARRDHAVAFARGADPGAVTIVPRLVIGLGGDWGDTSVELPEGRWINLMSATSHQGEVALTEILHSFPVALLERD